MSVVSSVASIASLVATIPLSCFGAPLLWLLLIRAISYTEFLASEEPRTSKPLVRPRSGRIKDTSVNKWYRHRRRSSEQKENVPSSTSPRQSTTRFSHKI
jgi:hypothetical protein